MQYHLITASQDNTTSSTLSKNLDHQLLLFFHGWSGNLAMLSHLNLKENDCLDVCIIYDYQSLTLPKNLIKALKNYSKVHLVAWSFGAWVANYICTHNNIKLINSIAYNGSLFPIHDQFGIPVRVAQATLKTLNEKNWMRFLKQMTLNLEPDQTQNFYEKNHIKAHRQSLAFLYQCFEKPTDTNIFNQAIISTNDTIIPTEAQKKAWDQLNTPYQLINAPHYPFINYNYWQELLE